MMVHQRTILVHTDHTIIYLTNTDTAYILIVVNGTDQYLGTCVWISLRSRDMIDDCLE